MDAQFQAKLVGKCDAMEGEKERERERERERKRERERTTLNNIEKY